MMDIIRDERAITAVGECEQCHQNAPGRQVESFGWMQEGRGHFFICLNCFKPRIFWRNEHGREFYTPATMLESKNGKQSNTRRIAAGMTWGNDEQDHALTLVADRQTSWRYTGTAEAPATT